MTFELPGLSQPDQLDIACFDDVCRNAKKYSFQPITIMASLMKAKNEVIFSGFFFFSRSNIKVFVCINTLGYFF